MTACSTGSPARTMVFVLGDSRTGTMSMHMYFCALGLKSKHFYMKETGVDLSKAEKQNENWMNIKAYIENSGFEAFSDYPTRAFYKELAAHYSHARFILTMRSSLEVWQYSMLKFFDKFNIPIDMKAHTQNHLKTNADIIEHFAKNKLELLVVRIDDDPFENSTAIKKFIGIESDIQIGWENKSDDYNNLFWSQRRCLYNTASDKPVSYLEAVIGDSKGALSEYGWVFLSNDTNQFLRYLFEELAWTDDNIKKALIGFKERTAYFEREGITYEKFVIPEKSVVYGEYLPRLLNRRCQAKNRPAKLLQKEVLEHFHYLDDYLIDLKSYGFLYFRGDTHTNWLGSYFVYLYIVERLNPKIKSKRRPPYRLGDLLPDVIGYNGDIYEQLSTEQNECLKTVWQRIQFSNNFEHVIRYTLPDDKRHAVRVETPRDYVEAFNLRETFVFESPDETLPRAVIFRDSTCDLCMELIAQHFSRSVFIWHKGLVYRDIIEREKPDVVIHMMAERFLEQYRHGPSLFSSPLAVN
jgi:hypothetical protein